MSARRTSVETARQSAVASARRTLQLTDAIASSSGGSVPIDDSNLLERLDTTDAGIDATLARLETRIALVGHVGAAPIDPARVDQTLRSSLQQTTRGTGISVIDFLTQLVLRFLAGLRGPELDIGVLWTAIGLVGVAVILFVLATLGRSTPERVRREVFVSDRAVSGATDTAAQLRAAEAALAAGRSREAIHALFLYVLASLSSREVFRYDPSFTDRELLVATAAIPHADALRDLVAIYERSWFGVREPSADEARRARELALRVAR